MLLVTSMLALSLGTSVPSVPSVPTVPSDTSYWQQRVRYEIRARLDEPSGVLSGTETVWYINQSPDTLHEFYLHLYLNAFRPGSRWSYDDSLEDVHRFDRLRDPDYGFNHVRDVTIGGAAVTATYPYATDSTIARFDLPRALAPGDSMLVAMQWDARPSTTARRQGRDGRRFDFAQWYPRVVAYDRYGWEDNPLQPAGEFYGEFGVFDVTLDLAQDQVIGATGVPIEGDPGWDHAKADASTQVDYERTWYDKPGDPATSRAPGCATMTLAAGRKCVRFYAADVHHFAMSLNPQYRYEQGRVGGAVVRVLYQPQDEATWGHGIAVGREEEALRWLGDLFGPFPWPQITNVHRIEGGGTEFPMMVMNGGASLGLILHETGHNYLMGILGNNEWKEGYLDEGFTSFQTSWYMEEHQPGYDGYYGNEGFILNLDLNNWSQPVSTPGHLFRDFNTYNVMTYTKGELFYDQIRTIVGNDVMRQILREYYRRYKFKHVDERAFLNTVEDVSGKDLKPLFGQWLHGTPLYDYAIGKVQRRQQSDGSWATTVEVKRLDEGIYPVAIGERTPNGVAIYAHADGRPALERVVFHTPQKPGHLMLDPQVRSHDWNFTNNYEKGGIFDLTEGGRDRIRLDTYVSNPAARDQIVSSLAPTVWYNDIGGATVGFHLRENYLGRFDRITEMFQVALGRDSVFDHAWDQRYGFAFTYADPTRLRRPHTSESVSVWAMEGVEGAKVTIDGDHEPSWFSPNVTHVGIIAQAVRTTDIAFRDRALWDAGGTAELTHYVTYDAPGGHASWHLDGSVTGGIAWTNQLNGKVLTERYDVEPFFMGSASVATRHHHGPFVLGGRLFGGIYLADHAPLKQRAVGLNGADPYQTFGNPFVRTPGALFVRPGVFYHSPGSGDLRGYAPSLGGRGLVAFNAEIEAPLMQRGSGVLRRVAPVVFWDGGLVDSLAVASTSGKFYTPVWDAGAGLRLGIHVGDLNVPLRFEMPFYVSRPTLAQDTKGGVDKFQFRWLFSLEQSF